MKSRAVFGALAVVMLVFSPPSSAQPNDELKALRKDVETLKEGQTAIQKELRELKSLLEQRQARPPSAPAAREAQPQNVVVTVDGAPFLGEKNAKVTLIEFSDYQCPFCSRHFKQTFSEIVKEYVETGKVKYVLRDFPLEAIHPQAFKAHEAAHCAGEEGKYWEMHGRLFGNQRALGLPDLANHARELGIDSTKFQQCLDSGKYAAEVRKGQGEGRSAGVSGTPSFFLGLTEPNQGKVKAVTTLRGAQPYARFKEAIDSLLSSEKGG